MDKKQVLVFTNQLISKKLKATCRKANLQKVLKKKRKEKKEKSNQQHVMCCPLTSIELCCADWFQETAIDE